ncbi:hypothetical protein B9Z55_012660 [Caenorhabditis nigoni]|uniref:Uncharacterized protein n=1 Tax=Caenorhabditis nigoni TaxID=1611254 RepID=A0A2G5TYA4_9PELO|nr:hypothetical protein B9Z55_012660 [Caenorhabditis nigoni]
MFITIVYIAVGLAVTTIPEEIAADALKKVNYFGRKIKNVGNVVIWFGELILSSPEPSPILESTPSPSPRKPTPREPTPEPEFYREPTSPPPPPPKRGPPE